MLAILQFDSVSLPVLEKMLAEGLLPTLAGLRRRGRWETIDAQATILQSATYPTLWTGVDVTQHGLYTAFPWSASEQRARFVHALPKPPTIWERLTRRGRHSLVVDPHFAWAPRDMAGVFLSGWQFRDRMVMQERSVPRRTRFALSRRHGRSVRLDDVYGTPRVSSLFALREHLVAAPQRAADATIALLRRDRFDLVWVTFGAAHKAGHHLWDAAAVVDEPLPDGGRVLRAGLEEVYASIDAAMRRILDALPDAADVIVFSPTGMGPNTSRADLLPGMLDAVLGGPGWRPAGANGHRTPVWSLRSRVPVGWRASIARALPDGVVADLTARLQVRADWRCTRAIVVPGENKGYVRLNLRGREREGIVDPAEADELLDSIARGLVTFCDPDGSPAIARVSRMAELAGAGPYAERLPDLVVSWADRPAARIDRVCSPHHGDVARRGVGSGRSGNHTDDAWAVLVPGSSRARALERPVRITDIGATACRLLDADATGLSGASLLESD